MEILSFGLFYFCFYFYKKILMLSWNSFSHWCTVNILTFQYISPVKNFHQFLRGIFYSMHAADDSLPNVHVQNLYLIFRFIYFHFVSLYLIFQWYCFVCFTHTVFFSKCTLHPTKLFYYHHNAILVLTQLCSQHCNIKFLLYVLHPFTVIS